MSASSTHVLELPILGDAKLVLPQLIEAVRERLGKQVRSRNSARKVARLKEQWLTSNERPLKSIVTHDSGSPAISCCRSRRNACAPQRTFSHPQ